MQCARCQTDNPPQAKFCLECASPLAHSCKNCGTQLPPTAKFCLECAHPVTGSGPTPNQPHFGSPHAYTPKHLAERILTSKTALEGERKQVTVLFADLKGSMELLADRDPEEARKLLDPVLERMMEAVHRYEGTVNQVMGDGIMALFGAPVAHEDHAVRACYAALDMQTAIRRYAEEVRRSHGLALDIRVGLNSGEVVVRAIGSDLRMDYSAVGQTTHLAARMEQLARPGSTLLTAGTLRLAEGYIEITPLGPVPIKGVEVPVEIYELAGAGPRRSRLHAAATRGLTRFVGRDQEMEQLRHALGRAAAGHGQIVAIVGEPGVGKSRLVWEVTHSHRTHGWFIIHAGSVSYGKATPYLPVTDLLKSYFGIQTLDETRAIREKVAGKILILDEGLNSIVPAILALLDVPVDDPQWTALDPQRRRRHTLEAIKRLLLRESQLQPVLVVFEDLHWIDSETQALLDSLVESLPTTRILLLTNYRPEYEHGWTRKTYYTQVRLDPLAAESADALLRALVGEDPGLESLKALLIARTEGNPFFLEESVRTLVETRVLSGEPRAYRVAKAVDPTQVPATVQAVLAARIDRLPPDEKRLLQSASVLGKDVPVGLLHAIADLSDDRLRQGLAHLQVAEFLYETHLFPNLEYTFKHALTLEVTYQSLLQERRRALHARVVDAIERLFPDRLIEQIERLAHHALRGEMWEKAFGYLREAGTKAVTRSAYQEATALWEQAVTVVPHLPETREWIEQAIDIRFDLRHALVQIGGLRLVLEHLREAERLAQVLGDRRRLGWVYDFMSNYLYNSGDHQRAMETAEHALAIGTALDDLGLTVAASFHLANARFYRGNYRQAVQVLGPNLELLERRPSGERLGLAAPPSILSRTWLALSVAELGDFADGTRYCEEAIRIAQETERDLDLTYAYWGSGGLHLRRGDLQRAIASLERGLAFCRVAFPGLFQDFASPLGHAYALSARVVEALPLLEQAVERVASSGMKRGQSLRTAYLAEGYLLAGRLDDARETGLHSLDLAREHQERGHEAWALRLLGEIASHSDPPDVEAAEAHYRQALALATELAMRPLVARCHLGLGQLYRCTGNPEGAREHLTTATVMYRDMGMTYWLERAEAAAT